MFRCYPRQRHKRNTRYSIIRINCTKNQINWHKLSKAYKQREGRPSENGGLLNWRDI